MSIWLLVAALSVPFAACGDSTRGSWRETGQSWGQGGRQFLRALGRSISGEGNVKDEWKKTGRELQEAGKDTAESVGDSIDPGDEEP